MFDGCYGAQEYAYADPPLTVTQTIPSAAYTNDATGQTYTATITNPAGSVAANNFSVEINIPNTGFAFVPGSLTNSKGLTTSISGTDPVIVSFSPSYNLPAGQSIIFTYKLATNCFAVEGDYPNTVTTRYDGSPASGDYNDGIITIVGRRIEISHTAISPLPYQVTVGDTVNLRAEVFNRGTGPIFNVAMTAEWGTGFASPALTGGTITPTLSGSKYSSTIPQIPAGGSVWFEYTLDVVSCIDITVFASAIDPCDATTVYKADKSPLLVLKQPNIAITTTDANIAYCGSGTMTATITNNDTPVGTRNRRKVSNSQQIFQQE